MPSLLLLKLLCLGVAASFATAELTTLDGVKCNDTVPSNAVYRSRNATIQNRVTDLLDYMCWPEKVAQLTGIGGLLSVNSTYNETLYRELSSIHQGSICK